MLSFINWYCFNNYFISLENISHSWIRINYFCIYTMYFYLFDFSMYLWSWTWNTLN